MRDGREARAEVAGLGLDEFLGHRTSGGGGSFLKNWKKEGSVEVFLHTRAPIFPLWAHGWHEEVEVEDDGAKVVKIYNRRFVCHERELILKKQKYREPRDIGEREMPPEVCPACLLGEHVFQMVQRGELSWTTPVFSFEGDDPEFSAIMHAGGMTGLFQKDDLTKKQIDELRKAGIRRDEAFKENMIARCQYVLSVVNSKDPSEGVLTALEATSLGDKLKLEIKKQLKRRKERGNPTIHPYPFEWSYDDGKEFSDKYEVVALEDEPSETILKLITGDPPDLSELVTPSNCLAFRAQVEAHLCSGIDLPLDEIFGPAERAGLMKAPASPPKGDRKGRTPEVGSGAPAQPKLPPGQGKAVGTSKAAMLGALANPPVKPAAKPEDDDGFQCDHCDAEMAADDLVCAGCGATYDEQTGKMDGRPCLTEGCVDKDGDVSVVLLAGDGPAFICPKCGALHEAFDDPEASPERKADGLTSWRLVPKKEEPKPEAPAGRRRRGAPAAPEPVASAPAEPAAAKGRASRGGAAASRGSASAPKA